MSISEVPHLIYLLLILVFIGGGVVLAFRGQIGVLLKQATAWALIFAAAIVAFGLWDDRQMGFVPEYDDQGRVEIPLSRDGHYHVIAEVNGTPIQFIVDTGATDVVLNQRDAMRAGLELGDLVFSGRAQTANGRVQTAPVRLEEVTLGGFEDRGIRAVVNSGDLGVSLLGMSYLQSFDRIEIRDRMLVLERL